MRMEYPFSCIQQENGIALNPTFEKEEDANAYLDLVAEYMGLINAN